METSSQPGLTAAPASGRQATTSSAKRGVATAATSAALKQLMFLAGDHVTIGTDTRVYKIVHLARHKAWVSALREPDHRLVAADELLLVRADVSTLRD